MMNKSAAIADAVKRSRIKVEPSSTLSLMLENKLNSLFLLSQKRMKIEKVYMLQQLLIVKIIFVIGNRSLV